MTQTFRASLVSLAAVALGLAIASVPRHWRFDEVLGTVATVAEVFILFVVVYELPNVIKQVGEIRDTTVTVRGSTDALVVGDRVHVLLPEPGKRREEWRDDNSVWRIVSVDPKTNRATAVPVAPPLIPTGHTPTVEGPMTGPLSPFIRI